MLYLEYFDDRTDTSGEVGMPHIANTNEVEK